MTAKAIGYVRASHDQTNADQRSVIEQFATQNDYELVQVYEDKGSAADPNRPGFDQLIKAAKSGHFEALICCDKSRLFRFDPLDAANYQRILGQANVKLVAISEA